MEQLIKSLIIEHASDLFGQEIDAQMIQFQVTRKDVEGDLTLVVFPFVKLMRCSPMEAGQKLGAFIENHVADVEKCIVVNGFLNIVFSKAYWLNQLNEVFHTNQYGFAPAGSKPTMMVEYSSPNTNKPLHLGHLRNIFLGHSVSEILKADGHEVIRTQVINDRGIHICKSMLAWERFQ
jgi:arginyl-tRNA synthetase